MSWKRKVSPPVPKRGLLAPGWYTALKSNGATEAELREATRQFCAESMQDEPFDDTLVDLMLTTYES